MTRLSSNVLFSSKQEDCFFVLQSDTIDKKKEYNENRFDILKWLISFETVTKIQIKALSKSCEKPTTPVYDPNPMKTC